MTYEQAIKLIEPLMLSSINTSVGAEKRPIVYAFDMAIKSLEKQIPKKPEKSYDGYFDGNPVYDYFCPCCHRNFEDNMPTFCEDCGQAIDWSEE